MYKFVSSFIRRQKKIRKQISKQLKPRLTVYKSNRHIYAQLFTSDGSQVILSISSLDHIFINKIKSLKTALNKTEKSRILGLLLAELIEKKNIKQVVFDRSGFKFHGRIKAVADSIHEKGILC